MIDDVEGVDYIIMVCLSPFWSPSIWNHYTGQKTYKTHSILAHTYHKSRAELWFTFAEQDIPHKSVFNTWKLSKNWQLG